MSDKEILKREVDLEKAKALAETLGISEVLSRILVARGIDDFNKAKAYFRPQKEDLHNPFLLKSMDKACEVILEEIQNNKPILVFGDYDVDGTTSVAMLSDFLSKIHPGKVISYIPDRYTEGYGISFQSIDFAKENGISLVICLDCGIRAVEQIEYAQRLGVSFVVCDHHTPGEVLPPAVAILNPKQMDCPYPYKELSGCGVGFKLMEALAEKLSISRQEVESYLDLVTVSICADIVPIDGENRILTHFGLEKLRQNPRPGLKVLIPEESLSHLDVSGVVFSLSPKINAAGRIDSGLKAVSLMMEKSHEVAQQKAKQISALNESRKEFDKEATLQALEMIIQNQEENNATTVVFDPHWHKGVVGIVASRLIENYYRPTVVFTASEGGLLVGSARSVSGYSVYDALLAISPLMEKFGGHKYAAGMSIKAENYDLFKQAFENQVKKTLLPSEKIEKIWIDSEVDFSDFSPKFLRIIEQMSPFGPANPKPCFLAKNVKIIASTLRYVGDEGQHLQCQIEQNGQVFSAIGFCLAERVRQNPASLFDVVFQVEYNHFRGNKTLQLNLKEISTSLCSLG
ncbi:MAG: single-stranded-DNA-specific exonuclease RecJ [Flavobacteriaceae bacterium]|nr:MAG: single-stranded-DNA-specific exonuclease RecJ [Flavobacteriaceae bacterium]